MKILVREALGYTAVSACALLVDIAILWILVHFFSWWYLAAATAPFAVGLLLGYALSVTWVFSFRRIKDPRLELLTFSAIGTAGLVINAAVIGFAVKILGLYYLVAKCTAAAVTFVWNFTARRQLLFARRRAA